MRIVIPDDYQDAVRSLDCFRQLAEHHVTVYHDSVKETDVLAERFREAEALVLIRERTAISEALLAQLPNLKIIAQTGRGAPHIDMAACTRHGVAVTLGGGTPYATAELTWGLVLASMRHIPQEYIRLKAGHWQTTLGTGLHGRTLGIFGYGNIGRLVASYGRVFGMRVLIWGRENSLTRARADGFETAASREALFSEADVLSLHIKLSEETRDLVTASDLAQMKPSALLVNTSRAGLIERGALEEAVRAGRPGYAAVDVYDEEPVVDHPLLHLDTVLCTPHLGYVEKDSYELYFGTAFAQLLAFADGKPTDVANPQALEHDRHKG
ncbi:MAG TPA: D-2-hydroxyacid dehydrogenase family protein [Ktedonobacteraceae bacterium]|nr:D-2-hydroxyacid dehydrogenase family protein [Ktedonobacteraceae bacterium]